MRYDPAMRTFVVIVVALVLTGAGSTAWADEPPSLAKARTLYNAGDYEGAIDAASVARKDEAWADSAALVVGRSHLELYRARAAADADGEERARAVEITGGTDPVLPTSFRIGETAAGCKVLIAGNTEAVS